MAATRPAEQRKQLVQLLEANTGAQSMYRVWTDWVELCALAISNGCDRAQWDEREARYMEIAKRYDSEEMGRFGEALGALVAAFEQEQFGDVLGETYMQLEIVNRATGQFFTPYHLCRMMAQMITGAEEEQTKREYITATDPACGAGALIIALAETLLDAGINYQERLHVKAQDIDAAAVHMAYIQLSLLHVPAVVTQGDTLRMEPTRSTWFTPAHILGGWAWRLRGKTAPGVVFDALALGVTATPEGAAA
jgi:hypothetical protein